MDNVTMCSMNFHVVDDGTASDELSKTNVYISGLKVRMACNCNTDSKDLRTVVV